MKIISIAMATYNGEKYLREQLDSIFAQTYTEWEIVVCDDCSGDGTVEILNEYAQKDSRIKVFVNKNKLGFRRIFEKAMGLCSGDYIALSDQDDVWTENHLELLVNNIGTADLIGGNALLVDAELKPINKTLLDVLEIESLPETKVDLFLYLRDGNIFQSTAMMFRRSLLSKIIPITNSVRFHDWWIACLASVGKRNSESFRSYPNHLTTVRSDCFTRSGTNCT